MASFFVDTNVFLRFLTNDDPAKAKRAETLFRNALRGKIRLETSLLVIADDYLDTRILLQIGEVGYRLKSREAPEYAQSGMSRSPVALYGPRSLCPCEHRFR
jgi:hypothetical protein